MKLFLKVVAILFYLSTNGIFSFAQDSLRIDSIVTTPVICDELGSIIIYASSDSLPLSYSVEGGLNPAVNNKFFHLKEGVYPIWVKDGLNRIVRDTVTISLNKFPVDIFPKNDTICSLDSLVQFSTSEPGGIWVGLGVDSVTGIFNPALTGSGSYWINYVLNKNDSCFTNSTRVFVLNEGVQITSPSSFCSSEEEVTLKAEPLGGIWEGDFVDSVGVLSIKSAGLGKHVVHYKVLTKCGYYEGVTDTIEVLQAPKITVTAEVDSTKTKCLPAYINMSYVSDIPVTNCQWTCDWGRVLDTCGSFVDSVFKSGAFRASLKVRNLANACEAVEESNEVKIGNKAKLSFFPTDHTPEVNEEIQFRNFSTNAVSHNWDFGDGLSSANESPFHSYSVKGVYNVSFYSEDDLGCIGSLLNKKIYVGKNDSTENHCQNMGFENGNLSAWVAGQGCNEYAIQRGDMIGDCHDPSSPRYQVCCPFPAELKTDLNLWDWEGRHTIISKGTDPYCKFPLLAPQLKDYTKSNYSLRLGNARPWGQVDRIERTFIVDETNAIFAFQYAVVLNNPENQHLDEHLPYFEVGLYDSNGGKLSCSGTKILGNDLELDEIIVDSVVQGTDVMLVRFKNWTPVFIDLTDYIGAEVNVRFTNVDCARGGHWAYSYITAYCVPFTPPKDLTVCAGSTVRLSSPFPIEGWDLQWSTGEITESIKVFPNQTTTYTLEVKSKTGDLDAVCTKQMNVTVYVRDSVVPMVLPQNTCKGEPSVLNVLPKDGQYSWYKEPVGGNSFHLGDELVLNSITVDTTFFVESGIKCLDNGVRVAASINIKNPKTGFVADKRDVKKGEIVQFTKQYPGANIFNWDLGDGTTTNLPNPQHAYTEKGIYTVSLIASDTMGCTDSLVKENYILVDTTTVIKEITNLNFFKASPNPMDNELNIQFKLLKNDQIEISIFNFFGQIVYWNKKNYDAGQLFDLKIDTEKFGNGVYLLRLKGSKTTKYFKVVKE